MATNDPAQSATTLTLKVRIVGSVELLPIPSVNVSVAGPESRPGRVLVRQDATETGTLKLAGLTASLPWLQAKAQVVKEPGLKIDGLPEPKVGDIVIEVTAKGDALEPGSSQATLTFDTGLPREPKVTVPVYVYVKGPITLGTQEVILQPGVDGMVLVALRSDVEMETVTATAEPAAFKATLERANATSLRLKIGLDATSVPAPTTGSVTVHAGDASATVRIRVVR